MNSALLVIDVQKEYDTGGVLEIPNLSKTLPTVSAILKSARDHEVPVFHIQHISLDPKAADFNAKTNGIDFVEGFAPLAGETHLVKHYPGSFWKTRLDVLLKDKDIDTLFICGYSSFLCCDTTAREAFQHGYKVFFIEDAIGEFQIGSYSTDEIHQYACTVQQEAGFSTVIKSKDILWR